MRLPIVLILGLVVAGCSTVPQETPSTTPAVTRTVSPTSVAVATVVATPKPTRVPSLLACHFGERCDAVPGTFSTSLDGFFPGLQITIPAGWHFLEQDAGEIILVNNRPDTFFSIAKDVRVVTTTRTMGPETQIVDEVAGTPEAFVEWFTNSPDFTVIEQPRVASIAGVTGTMFALEVSESAVFGDPGCPFNPRCGDIFTDPAHWGPNVFSIGGDEATRMFVASIPYAGVDHLLAIDWIVPSAADLPAFVAETQSIVDSIKLPVKFIQN